MRARRAAGVLLVALGLGAVATVPPPVTTAAAWTDGERATSSTLTAITVASPGRVRCVVSGLLVPATVGWDAPVAGANVSSYRWTMVGASNRSGTLPASATSVTITANAIELGTSTFTLIAVGPGGWETPATNTATIGFLSLVLGVTSSCAVT